MRLISNTEMAEVSGGLMGFITVYSSDGGGGGGYGGGGGGGGGGYDGGGGGYGGGATQTVEIIGSRAAVDAAKADYANANNAAAFLSGFAGFGTGAVVGGGCVLGATLFGGPGGGAVAAKPCAAVATVLGIGVGATVSNKLRTGINSRL